MRKFLKFAFVGAIALTGFGFTSCSSDEDFNETTNLTGEAVKTQFTISFPENVARTKQTAATVQNAQDLASFRGMEQIKLIPFAKTTNTPIVSSSDVPVADPIGLVHMILPSENASANNTIPAGGLVTNGNNSVLYQDVTIPIGTGAFLFYGVAPNNATYTDAFYNGKLNFSYTNGAAPSTITVTPEVIYGTSASASAVGDAIATYLTNIANATGWAAATDEGLKSLYQNFTNTGTATPNGLKVGSSRHTQAAVQDLYRSICAITNTSLTSVTTAIKNAILNATYASETDATTHTLTFTAALGNSDATYYPGDVNIPDGAALLAWDDTNKKFDVVRDGGTTYIGNKVTANFADYVYPASLYYRANSAIETANGSRKDEYTKAANDTWAKVLATYTDGDVVQALTRSVAIEDQIEYAVGRLDATVKAGAATLYDRNGDAVTVSAETFPVTGVLIGGQKSVDYTFAPSGSTWYTIYDNIVKSQPVSTGYSLYAGTTASAVNYTLALETADDASVNIAIELQNNSTVAFRGADGIVPVGGRFYLVATLTPSAGGANYATVKKIFKQDYKTLADFTILAGTAYTSGATLPVNTTGLGAAYNTIPDLRTPQLELGLSVNLQWQSGLTFNVDL